MFQVQEGLPVSAGGGHLLGQGGAWGDPEDADPVQGEGFSKDLDTLNFPSFGWYILEITFTKDSLIAKYV